MQIDRKITRSLQQLLMRRWWDKKTLRLSVYVVVTAIALLSARSATREEGFSSK